MTSVLWLGIFGGIISFASTSLGALISLTKWNSGPFAKLKFSIDFALGLMLSAVAFSLVAPAAENSLNNPKLFVLSLLGFAFGGILIYGLKLFIERRQTDKSDPTKLQISSSQLVLALALIVHNFPEGLASGASLAALDLKAAIPILTSISIQNVPEGLLMVLCLKGMGWSMRKSFVGGIFSGVVELIGGVVAGLLLSQVNQALPVILMMAGGAMFTSVVIELKEHGNFLARIKDPQFAMGALSLPLLMFILPS